MMFLKPFVAFDTIAGDSGELNTLYCILPGERMTDLGRYILTVHKLTDKNKRWVYTQINSR